ncbi:MAG: hypothetical protein IPF92_29765 [Myxococcales bacterium]|nr:hypothetical protein [Myxococcales bacterium]
MMTRLLLCLAPLVVLACGAPEPATPSSKARYEMNDAESVSSMEAALAKPLPEAWKRASVAFVPDPVAACPRDPTEDEVKKMVAGQIERAKKAMEALGVAVIEDPNSASVALGVQIFTNCNANNPDSKALVTGMVYAMPKNAGPALKSDLFAIKNFDAGRVTQALMRDPKLSAALSAP